MLRFLRPYLHFAFFSLVAILLEATVDLLQPKLMESIVNNTVLSLGEPGVFTGLFEGAALMVGLTALGALFGVSSGVFSNLCAQSFGNDLRKAAFSHMLSLSIAQSQEISSGSLITRMTNDVTQVQAMISAAIRGVVRALMFLVAGTAMILSLDIRFGAVAGIAVPLIIVEVVLIMMIVRPLFKRLQERVDAMNLTVEEDIRGARVIKGFAREAHAAERFEEANEALAATRLHLLLIIAMLPPLVNIVMNLAIVGVLYVGGLTPPAPAMPGTVMAAITYSTQILIGLMMLGFVLQHFIRGMTSQARLAELFRLAPAITDGAYPHGEPSERGTIRLEGATFTYPGAHEETIRGVSLAVRSGETVAVVGATGSGKTTLAFLLLRLYEVTGGSVSVDGIDVRDYPQKDLRDKMSLALQKAELFRTSIRENIRMGRPGATDEEVAAAAKIAQAHDFITAQSDGYDTEVHEGGTSLSGGQRQRVALARALIRRPEILILDDATSALDARTEAAFYAALDTALPGTTRIIIAQRIATARHADRIAVLDAGRIVACAPHDELIRTSPLYRKICASQSVPLKRAGADSTRGGDR